MKFAGSILLLLYCCVVGAQQSSPEINTKRVAFNFTLFCQGCHGQDGAGLPGNVPRVRDFMGNFLRVEGGREFLIQVPGSAFSSLDDNELAELLNWMLMELSPGETPDDFEHYTADEVGKLRKNALTEVNEIRAALIRKMQALNIDVAENGKTNE